MFYLLPFGVGGPSPHIPGHPTSMCDLGVNVLLTMVVIRAKIILLAFVQAK